MRPSVHIGGARQRCPTGCHWRRWARLTALLFERESTITQLTRDLATRTAELAAMTERCAALEATMGAAYPATVAS